MAGTQTEPRPICEIAQDIYDHWTKVNFAAAPYLEAMTGLTTLEDKYFEDSAKYVINYFLSNAGSWRGPDAKRIKDELKAMIGRK